MKIEDITTKYQESQRTIQELRKELEYLQNDKILALQKQELKLKEESYKKFLQSNKDHLQRFIKEELSNNLEIDLAPDDNSSITAKLYLYKQLISISALQITLDDDPSSMEYQPILIQNTKNQ